MENFLETQRIIRAIRSMKSELSVASSYDLQMRQIKRLLKNDTTGLVVPIMDFHIEAATTSFKIETNNDTLNENLKTWQETLLNKDINICVPRGLRELTTEYMRERLTSSNVVLRVKWEEYDFGGSNNKWIIPAKIWMMDGSNIYAKTESSNLRDQKFFIKTSGGEKPLVTQKDESLIIRKPFNSWYEICPTPYLVKRGVLFNALFKQLIINKQSSSLEQLIPLLLLMTAGANKLGEMGATATLEEMKEFKDSLIKSIKEHDYTGEIGKIIAVLNGDVKLEAMIPEFHKLTDKKITDACDKNILSGMGLIEIQAFSKTRQESMLNPQVFVTDVLDSVYDWADLLREIMLQMLEKNSESHPTLSNSKIRVVPGRVKTFLTDNMKRLIMLAHDKGTMDTESYLEDVFDKALEDVLFRREKESKMNLEEKLYPRVTQNQEQYSNVKDFQKNDDPEGKKEEQGKKPGSPESRNYKTASLATCPKCEASIDYTKEPEVGMGYIKCPNCKEVVTQKNINAEEIIIDTIREDIKESLPMGARIIFAQAYNEAIKEKGKEDSINSAFEAVQEKYKLNPKNKWVKK